MNLNDTYFGFTDNMKPMQKAKVEKLLDQVKRFDGVILSNKEFIYRELKSGLMPEVKENCQYYKRNGELSKPKTEYRLKSIEDSCYWEIQKTLFDFANYILENDFLDEKKVKNLILTEQNKLQQEKQKKLEQEQEEQEKRIKFNQWLTEAAQNYSNTRNLQILENIFIKKFGGYSPNSIKLLVLIDNFDDPQCKEEIKDWLAYFNTASLKTFEIITGIKLGKTDKEIQAKLDQITSKDFRKIV